MNLRKLQNIFVSKIVVAKSKDWVMSKYIMFAHLYFPLKNSESTLMKPIYSRQVTTLAPLASYFPSLQSLLFVRALCHCDEVSMRGCGGEGVRAWAGEGVKGSLIYFHRFQLLLMSRCSLLIVKQHKLLLPNSVTLIAGWVTQCDRRLSFWLYIMLWVYSPCYTG